MASISVSGIGSGLDIESIVDGLMQFESRALDTLEDKASLVEAQISAYGQLKSSVSSFQSAMEDLASLDKFQIFAPTSSDEGVATATAGTSAVEGSYEITVTQLASSHKVASAGFADRDTVVGEGQLTVDVGGTSMVLDIDSSNSTLEGIRDAINTATDNPGVSATIITDNTGSRLVLSSDETGSANTITVSATNGGTGDLSQLGSANLIQVSEALDAEFYIEDPQFAVTSASNSVSSAIQGVTLELAGLGTTKIEIARDDGAITESVQAFIDAFNNLRNQIDSLRSGTLEAENTLLNIDSQLRSVLNDSSAVTGSSYKYLFEAGVSITKDGELELDSEKLKIAMNTDFDSFANLFAADNGFANRFDAIADALLATDGLIDAREDGLNTRLDRLDDQQLRVQYRLELTEERIRAQFTTLDTLISNLNATGQFLTQQLASSNSN